MGPTRTIENNKLSNVLPLFYTHTFPLLVFVHSVGDCTAVAFKILQYIVTSAEFILVLKLVSIRVPGIIILYLIPLNFTRL